MTSSPGKFPLALTAALLLTLLGHGAVAQDPGATVTAEDIPVAGAPSDSESDQDGVPTAPDVDEGDPAEVDSLLDSDEVDPAPIADSAVVADYRRAVGQIEEQTGAYAPGLSEQLLGLGLALQEQGRHEEAIDVFKRGVHLARINDGLYSDRQIPLLQSEIASHIAVGEFNAADERQVYLYRVQQRALDAGEARAQALMQQAQWQRRAYDLGLGEYGYTRLLSMWDLYRMALNDIAEREGDTSPQLLSPLMGMLQSQYLIAGFRGETASGAFNVDAFGTRQPDDRFNAYRGSSFKRGEAVITAIYEINQRNSGGDKRVAAEDLVMLGDWRFWHGLKEGALETYRQALAELAELDDAQEQVDRLFGEPTPLPAIDGVRPLPPTTSPDMADLLVEFGVSAGGRVVDVSRIDDGLENESRANRLMRQLRQTRFRPRFEAGEAVDTDKLSWAYDTTGW